MMTQLSLFKTEVANNIRKFERVTPGEEWMVFLVDFVTDVMTPTQWKWAFNEMINRHCSTD